MTSNLKLENILSNKITVYKNNFTFNTLNIIIIEFEDIFIDSKSTIDLSKD